MFYSLCNSVHCVNVTTYSVELTLVHTVVAHRGQRTSRAGMRRLLREIGFSFGHVPARWYAAQPKSPALHSLSVGTTGRKKKKRRQKDESVCKPAGRKVTDGMWKQRCLYQPLPQTSPESVLSEDSGIRAECRKMPCHFQASSCHLIMRCPSIHFPYPTQGHR